MSTDIEFRSMVLTLRGRPAKPSPLDTQRIEGQQHDQIERYRNRSR